MHETYVSERGLPKFSTLDQHSIVVPMKASANFNYWNEILKLEHRCRSAVRVSEFLDGEALVRAGVGFGLCNAIRLNDDVTELTEFRPFHHPIHLMVRRDFFSNSVNREFVDLLVAYSRARFGRSAVNA